MSMGPSEFREKEKECPRVTIGGQDALSPTYALRKPIEQ
jgi:hypothetical protein